MNEAIAVPRGVRPPLMCLLIVATLLASPAGAAEESRDEARSHFKHALELIDAARFEEAAVEFERAHELSPNPAVLYNLGQAHAAARHPAQAVTALRRYLAELTDTTDSRREQALRELPRLEAQIGSLALSVEPSTVEVRVDGRSVQLARPLLLDPGRHLIIASAAGYTTAEREIITVSGAHQTLELKLSRASTPAPEPTLRLESVPAPPPPTVAPPHVSKEPARSEREHRRDSSQQRFWRTATAAGAGLVLGGVSAGLALDSAARYRDWRDEQALLDQRWRSAPPDADLLQRQAGNDARARHIKLQDEVAVGVGVAGAACLAAAVVLWLFADSPAATRAAAVWSPHSRTGTLSMTW